MKVTAQMIRSAWTSFYPQVQQVQQWQQQRLLQQQQVQQQQQQQVQQRCLVQQCLMQWWMQQARYHHQCLKGAQQCQSGDNNIRQQSA